MNSKQVYELTSSDLNEHLVWFFPMDETSDDELTVRPSLDVHNYQYDKQCIVHTIFETNAGENFVGYIYWGRPEIVEYLKPVMFVGDEYIAFWSGIIIPSLNDHESIFSNLNKIFPIKFKSSDAPGLPSIYGVLEGIYYIDDAGVTQCCFPV